MSNPTGFEAVKSPNMDYFMNALTSDKITKMSGGKLQPMSVEQASGLVGSWMIETGQMDLGNLDVVEKGNNGAGRGLSQYTGVRRGPYDAAAAAAKKKGIDTNGAEFQLQYFVDEYVGKHDPAPGKSLIGWTKVLEKAPASGSPEDFARHYTGSAAEQRGYFRPGKPHQDRRDVAARSVYNLYKGKVGNPLNVQEGQDNRPSWMKALNIPAIVSPL